MKFYRWIILITLLFTAGINLIFTSPVLAHHSQAPFFHRDRTVEVEGTVTRWRFRNPHPYLYLEVTDKNGEIVEWVVQFATVNLMARRGWSSETFTKGEIVRVIGHPSKAPGSHGLEFVKIFRADGTQIDPGMGPYDGL